MLRISDEFVAGDFPDVSAGKMATKLGQILLICGYRVGRQLAFTSAIVEKSLTGVFNIHTSPLSLLTAWEV
jgi:hypothetical protein